ncbi:5-formyltetrahydrofolate cyclo-ligase [Zeaxanthinibacter enoshimensis]|uniref:5-formyltetrahydrofolate cyclo-ligase n=1 Tax=Zeaxanthinibacter enoshimensis TaxID=392009 RepID=A0A4R6TRY3_9FLAO|nr:5-formyltetrahydrofolate cyclo-ligase [Zeaxanthinibacter enoshimensis]TDQ33087.1 5-formyltetrahydrofolate cyclo-ligase [Zeaxanthinibacter enoshimensis]
MLKKGLRNQYTKLRLSMDPETLDKASLSIANQLLKIPVWDHQYYHLFLQIAEKKEIDTSYILTLLQGRDKDVVIPRMGDQNQLQHILLTDSTKLVKNKWNIPEPVKGLQVPVEDIDVVFIPLLAFDTRGHRVGYGKGFYDIFLAACRPETVKIGLSLFEATPLISDVQKTDIPLDYCVTPEKIYDFTS